MIINIVWRPPFTNVLGTLVCATAHNQENTLVSELLKVRSAAASDIGLAVAAVLKLIIGILFVATTRTLNRQCRSSIAFSRTCYLPPTSYAYSIINTSTTSTPDKQSCRVQGPPPTEAFVINFTKPVSMPKATLLNSVYT